MPSLLGLWRLLYTRSNKCNFLTRFVELRTEISFTPDETDVLSALGLLNYVLTIPLHQI
jgi:hypothetical protein